MIPLIPYLIDQSVYWSCSHPKSTTGPLCPLEWVIYNLDYLFLHKVLYNILLEFSELILITWTLASHA